MRVAIFLLYAISTCYGATLKTEHLEIVFTQPEFHIQILNGHGSLLKETLGPLLLTTVTGQEVELKDKLWWQKTNGTQQPWKRLSHVQSEKSVGDTVFLELSESESAPALATIRAFFITPTIFRCEIDSKADGINRTQIRLADSPEDLYYGMGQRFFTSEHKGTKVRVWAEEKAMFLTGERKDRTYYPVPFYFDPKGYGFLLDSPYYSEFDFNSPNALDWDQALKLTVRDDDLHFNVYAGETPLEILENFTAHTGRITHIPPPWVFAPWQAIRQGFGDQTGGAQSRAYALADTLRKYKIPTGAIWSEDWYWGDMLQEAWKVDRKAYPNYATMIDNMNKRGYKYLGYFFPMISPVQAQYAHAKANDYLVKDPEGEPYVWPMTSGIADYEVSYIDVTNPEAVEWFTESFLKPAVEEYGVSGWMHDFGEYTPPDAIFHNGKTGDEMHNRYSTQWIKIAREYLDRAKPDGDYILFPRSGYIGTQSIAEMMVTGDHAPNWEKGDGLPASIPAMLSRGLSGASPIGGTDIAAYFCLAGELAATGKELFMRWVELGALQPVMRHHKGLVHCDHWDFIKDHETLLHYRKYARLHTYLFPYLYTLVHEARDKGHPIMRHLVLQYPSDKQARESDYEYLLGDRLLAAPVLEPGANTWEVYFPEGRWIHYWSENTYEGPGTHTVPAPLGEAPLFVAEGKLLPMYTGEIETLVKEDREDLHGWDEANSVMDVRFFGDGYDSLTLWDGTHIEVRRYGDSCDCSVSGDTVGRTYNWVDCEKVNVGVNSSSMSSMRMASIRVTDAGLLVLNPTGHELTISVYGLNGKRIVRQRLSPNDHTTMIRREHSGKQMMLLKTESGQNDAIVRKLAW